MAVIFRLKYNNYVAQKCKSKILNNLPQAFL